MPALAGMTKDWPSTSMAWRHRDVHQGVSSRMICIVSKSKVTA
jgi:hypothetical protein